MAMETLGAGQFHVCVGGGFVEELILRDESFEDLVQNPAFGGRGFLDVEEEVPMVDDEDGFQSSKTGFADGIAERRREFVRSVDGLRGKPFGTGGTGGEVHGVKAAVQP